jgi:hypothetical protein
MVIFVDLVATEIGVLLVMVVVGILVVGSR